MATKLLIKRFGIKDVRFPKICLNNSKFVAGTNLGEEV